MDYHDRPVTNRSSCLGSDHFPTRSRPHVPRTDDGSSAVGFPWARSTAPAFQSASRSRHRMDHEHATRTHTYEQYRGEMIPGACGSEARLDCFSPVTDTIPSPPEAHPDHRPPCSCPDEGNFLRVTHKICLSGRKRYALGPSQISCGKHNLIVNSVRLHGHPHFSRNHIFASSPKIFTGYRHRSCREDRSPCELCFEIYESGLTSIGAFKDTNLPYESCELASQTCLDEIYSQSLGLQDSKP